MCFVSVHLCTCRSIYGQLGGTFRGDVDVALVQLRVRLHRHHRRVRKPEEDISYERGTLVTTKPGWGLTAVPRS